MGGAATPCCSRAFPDSYWLPQGDEETPDLPNLQPSHMAAVPAVLDVIARIPLPLPLPLGPTFAPVAVAVRMAVAVVIAAGGL